MFNFTFNKKERTAKLLKDMSEGRIGDSFQFPSFAKNDKKIALKVLALNKVDGLKLKWFSSELQKDEELIAIALRKSPEMLLGLSKAFQIKHVSLIGETIDKLTDTKCFQSIDKSLLENEIIAQKILLSFGSYIRFMSDTIKDNTKLVQLACKSSPEALLSASARLKEDFETVKIAIHHYPESIRYADRRYRKDYGFGGKILREGNGMSLQYVSPELKKDPSTVRSAMSQNVRALEFADEKLKKDIYYYRNIFLFSPYEMDMFFNKELKDDQKCLFEFEKWLRQVSPHHQEQWLSFIKSMDIDEIAMQLADDGKWKDNSHILFFKRAVQWVTSNLTDDSLTKALNHLDLRAKNLINLITEEQSRRNIYKLVQINEGKETKTKSRKRKQGLPS